MGGEPRDRMGEGLGHDVLLSGGYAKTVKCVGGLDRADGWGWMAQDAGDSTAGLVEDMGWLSAHAAAKEGMDEAIQEQREWLRTVRDAVESWTSEADLERRFPAWAIAWVRKNEVR